MHRSGRRVLILSGQPLFAQALRNVVENSASEVVGVESYDEGTWARVQALQPDIIILDDADLPPLLLSGLLDYAPTVRVIRLTLQDNLMRVYDGQQLTAYQAQDLVDVLSVPGPIGRT